MHQDASRKAKLVWCSKDRAKAWQDLMLKGTLPTGNMAVGYGITADGNTIVGAGNGFQGQRALMWTAATGIVAISPTALAPNGPVGSPASTRCTSIGGMSRLLGRM